ncbi:MAG: NfeD family protein [Neisseriaceae bacterium]|nr:NfeD family protein [Neisseriaceae bacterium]
MTWFAIALIALVLEVLSGTFYLLVLSIACAITGIIDHIFNPPDAINLTICGILSFIGIVLATYWHRKKRVIPMSENTVYDDLDLGQNVTVIGQNNDGLYQVQYRGAVWQAQPDNNALLINGQQAKIVGKNANILIVK